MTDPELQDAYARIEEMEILIAELRRTRPEMQGTRPWKELLATLANLKFKVYTVEKLKRKLKEAQDAHNE